MEDENKDTQPSEQSPAPAPTTTSVEADLGQRIGAGLIDMIVATVLSYAVGMISTSLGYPVALAYLLTRDSLPFLDGQSVGKKAVNLKAVTEAGESLSGNWNPGIVRNVTMAVPFFPLVELIIMLVKKDEPGGIRRLGDQFAKTKVVKVVNP